MERFIVFYLIILHFVFFIFWNPQEDFPEDMFYNFEELNLPSVQIEINNYVKGELNKFYSEKYK